MVLHAESAVSRAFHTFDGLIQEVDMRCLKRCRRKAFPFYGIGVVLGCDLDLSRRQIFDGMVAAPVAELEFIGAGSVGQRQDLVAQTDPENGKTALSQARLWDLRGRWRSGSRPGAEP